MLRRAVSIGGVAAAVLPLIGIGPASAGDPGRCAVIDGAGRCLVEAADPGRPGGPEDGDRRAQRGSGGTEARHRERARPTAKPAPEPERPVLRGLPFLGPDGRPGGVVEPLPELDLPTEPRRAAPVNPAVLARRAIESLSLQPPDVQVSAATTAYVGIPIWLWIDGGLDATGPVSATATAGSSRVTATGRLVAVEWAMGPRGAVVRCAGPGTPWTGQRGPSPDCGYTYHQRSLPERTNGTGQWMINTTAVWQVTWSGLSAGAPVSGAEAVRLSSQRPLSVGEIQVLVSEGGHR